MRISESQLRRVVKRLMREAPMPRAMPRAMPFNPEANPVQTDLAGEVASRWMESGKDRYATIAIAEDLMDEIFDAFGRDVAANAMFVAALKYFRIPEDTAVSIANTCYDAVM